MPIIAPGDRYRAPLSLMLNPLRVPAALSPLIPAIVLDSARLPANHSEGGGAAQTTRPPIKSVQHSVHSVLARVAVPFAANAPSTFAYKLS